MDRAQHTDIRTFIVLFLTPSKKVPYKRGKAIPLQAWTGPEGSRV